MRAMLDTWPLLSLAGHCLISCCTVPGALLAAVLVADFSSNSFSSEILCTMPVSVVRCVSANCDHLLVNTPLEFVRALSRSSNITVGSSLIFFPFDAFVFFLGWGLVTSCASRDLRLSGRLGFEIVLTDYSSSSSSSSSPPVDEPNWDKCQPRDNPIQEFSRYSQSLGTYPWRDQGPVAFPKLLLATGKLKLLFFN